MRKASAKLVCSLVLSSVFCNTLLIYITSDQIYYLQKNSEPCSQSFFFFFFFFCKSRHEHVKPLLEKASLAPSQRKATFQNGHLCLPFLGWYAAIIPIILSLYVTPFILRLVLTTTTKKLCARWKLKDFGHWSSCSGAPCLEQSCSGAPCLEQPVQVHLVWNNPVQVHLVWNNHVQVHLVWNNLPPLI